VDSNLAQANASDNFYSYKCPTSVLLIRPLTMDCIAPQQAVTATILDQLIQISKSIGDKYQSTKLFQNISLDLKRDNCPPLVPQVQVIAIVTISDPPGIPDDSYPLHAFDLAWELRIHPSAFDTDRTGSGNTLFPATRNSGEAFIVVDDVTPIFGSPTSFVPPPPPPPPAAPFAEDTIYGLSLMWWVIIIFIVVIFILCCCIITLYILGTKNPQKR